MIYSKLYISMCVKSARKKLFWSVFSRIRTEYGETRSIYPYTVRMRENVDQNNSEYGHISRSIYYKEHQWILQQERWNHKKN